MDTPIEVLLLEDARDFIMALDEKSRLKLLLVLKRFSLVRDPRLFKKITGDIWEFRQRTRAGHIRLLAFFDPNAKSLVICTHGFMKKTSKVPKKEIEKAEKLRITYLSRYNEGI